MISDETRATLRGFCRTLRIIVFSLFAGVAIFTGYAVTSMEKPLDMSADALQLHMLVLAAGAIPATVIVPLVIMRTGNESFRKSIESNPKQRGFQDQLTGDPANDAAVIAAAKIQMSTIVGCAILEGAAFGNAFSVMSASSGIHLIVVGVLLLGIVFRFPTPSGFVSRIERLVEDEQMRNPE